MGRIIHPAFFVLTCCIIYSNRLLTDFKGDKNMATFTINYKKVKRANFYLNEKGFNEAAVTLASDNDDTYITVIYTWDATSFDDIPVDLLELLSTNGISI